ncbi:glycosyltransferase [Streptomyces huiliensis]|uniref:glycosyltransferase n=1 Tax=Streptomyces huiliensis TaxID=2876027 RepID=UPI001CBF76EF|nr:glycosyltransferase [Streptomyces huiliensis]MBZ4322372.1 glycosyltransferase [Streptomyces huiliensis]
MRILITAAGSRGDVAPYTGLGARLRADGHDVTLATHDLFAPLVHAAGLGFRPLPGDPRSGRRDGDGGNRQLMRTAAAFVGRLGSGLADAVTGDGGRGLPDLLLLSTTTAPLGRHLAEATGVRTLDVFLQPTAPTGDFPPVVGGTRSLGRFGNRTAGRLALRVTDRLYADAVRTLRADLGLPPATPSAVRRRHAATGAPVLHGFTEALVPRPADWPSGHVVTGPWWPHQGVDRLPAALEDFLAAGPPPVLVGFGSMPADDAERLSGLVVAALRRAGLRGVLQAGTAGLSAAGDDVLTVGDVPHAPLFPRLAAVVHHAGAGTTAATLRAGVPSVPVPVMADQPFWAARLAARGAAPAPVPFRELTAERLADALREATTERSYAEAARRLAGEVAGEDGAERVAEAVAAYAGA